MKNLVLPFLIFLCFCGLVQAQTENGKNQYNKNGSFVWISLTNGAVLGKGLLWKVIEESIEFVKLEDRKKFVNEMPILKIHYSEILEIKTTPRQAIKKGAVVGAAIGFATGLTVGLATTENPAPYTITETSPEFCLLFICFPADTYDVVVDEPKDSGIVILKTLAFTIVGTIVGIVKGNAIAVEEKIEGSQDKYLVLVPELKKQAFWSPSPMKIKKKNGLL